jgi:precorrin-6Y C5,15-methyltransferase (decarboxylating)
MIHVLGLGLCPAHRSPEALNMIRSADLVAGGRRLLDELGITEDRRLALASMDEFAARIRDRAQDGSVCVLADGDPLLYGIGASLLRFFAPHELTFHPNVSAMQTACARFGLPWHDCKTLSLHGRSDLAPLFAALSHGSVAALYTDQQHSPDAIAELLLERGVKGWRMHVAENLCAPEERLTTLTLAEAAQRRWHTLNLVLLERTEAPPLTLELGLDDSALAHDQGLMTKQPVRAFALSLLRLTPDATLWDLGAGSGAVSLEAARLLSRGHVVAVERQAERVEHIKENVARTGAWLVEVVQASLEEFLEEKNGYYRTYGTHGTYKKADKAQDERPGCLEYTSHMPHTTHTSHFSLPTHIFLGGGASPAVLTQCAALLSPGGRLVVAAVLLSTLENARAVISQLGWPLTVHQLMHHASSPLGVDLRLVPSNPVFLLETQKPSSDT